MTLEIVAQSLEDALTAEAAGANRLELVSALSLGGLTPSIGMVEAVIARCALPVVAMLRPRSGGFAYRDGELAAMEGDGERFLGSGTKGLVFGVLDERGISPRNARFVRLGGEAVFHRAFDLLPDPFDGLERLIDMGFRRLLTSGGRGGAPDNVDAIRRLVERADGRIEILAGGGVRAASVVPLVAGTGVSQIHLAALSWSRDATGGGIDFNAPHPDDAFAGVDREIVDAVRRALAFPERMHYSLRSDGYGKRS